MTTMLPEAPAVVEKPTEVQVLERAAEILEEYGWVQCCIIEFTDGTQPDHIDDIRDARGGAYCAMGAIWRAAADFGYAPASYKGLMEEAARRGLKPGNEFSVVSGLVGLHSREAWMAVIDRNDRGMTSAGEATAYLRTLAMERMP